MLVLVSALTYLPLVSKFGYYFDDWYLMFDAKTQGAQFFTQVFKDDRPLRAFVMIPAYTLFGTNPLPYNLMAYLFRVCGALGFLWIVRILWPGKRTATFLMALLFLIYPGFLSQPNAIDYLSHQLSLMLAMLSIALTLSAVTRKQRAGKWLLHLGALVLGWLYLGLMEYFLGFEVFRFGAVFLLVYAGNERFLENIVRTLRVYWPALFIPFGFLTWRLLIFSSERAATDLGAQIGQLAGSPVLAGLWWLVHFVQSVLNTVVLAWGVPLYDLAFQLRLRDFLAGFGIALVCALIIVGVLFWFRRVEPEHSPEGEDWTNQAILLGLLGIIGGLVLVIIANRSVDFLNYSRYTLVSSAGAVMAIVGVLYKLRSEKVRVVIVALMVSVAVLTHYANSIDAVLETQSIKNFWWQASWRIPQIKKGATLVAHYPVSRIPEEYFIWGPANMIYAPEKQEQDSVVIPIPAALLTPENVLNISSSTGKDRLSRRGVTVEQDFSNVLVMTQPTVNVCVRVLDGSSPEISAIDPYEIMLVAASSRIDNVLSEGSSVVPQDVFGPEPAHDWCYYYEKAALARQEKDWEAALSLREAALQKGYYPSDPIEWMPFLQAYTALGDVEGLKPYVSIMAEEPLVGEQTCAILRHTSQTERPEDGKMKDFVEESFCR